MSQTLSPSENPRNVKVLDSLIQVAEAKLHPANLLRHVTCVDSRAGDTFDFQLEDTDNGWYWQRGVLDEWLTNEKWIGLKARQLGITWLAAGYGLWKGLISPGSTILVISVNQDEAAKVINRIWDMYQSLPKSLQFGTRVLKPTRGSRPFDGITLEHPNGRISKYQGMPATKKTGHGETSAVVILDEFSRQEYASDIWKGVLPTMADGGKIIVISTANGVSNEESGEGNYFHHLWVNAENYHIKTRFMGWQHHPDRDQEWYNTLSMTVKDKAEQYPDNPREAFILSGNVYFNVESLKHYSENLREGYRCEFKRRSKGTAGLWRTENGCITVYSEPEPDKAYGVAADIATGRGSDYSVAYVVDLSSMDLCAEFRGKVDSDLLSYQLHYLGKWYNSAVLAVEMGGGYGEPVVVNLRDGKDGRPSYPKLYRHRALDSPEIKEQGTYGFPMTMKTRPLVINALEQAIRERLLPHLPANLLTECQTFVSQNTLPSPRAQDGCNDDCVFAAAIALELYRQYGHHPNRNRRKIKSKPKSPYPWLAA